MDDDRRVAAPVAESASVEGRRHGHSSIAAAGIEADVPRETSMGVRAEAGVRLTAAARSASSEVDEIPLEAISPNPHQPREGFDPESISALADSIKSSGLLQPIVVRPAAGARPGRFEVIAGERRLRAAQHLGWSAIPAIVRSATDRESAQFALIENVQREDLNPVERAFAVRSLCEDFDQTHQQVAESVGLDRASVSNLIRLTELDGRTLDLVRRSKLSAGHARALLAVKDLSIRSLLADTAVMEEWSVRTLEREVQRAVDRAQSSTGSRSSPGAPTRSAHVTDLETRLSRALGTPVHIQLGRKKGSGKMTIDFFSNDQFEGVLARLGVESSLGG